MTAKNNTTPTGRSSAAAAAAAAAAASAISSKDVNSSKRFVALTTILISLAAVALLGSAVDPRRRGTASGSGRGLGRPSRTLREPPPSSPLDGDLDVDIETALQALLNSSSTNLTGGGMPTVDEMEDLLEALDSNATVLPPFVDSPSGDNDVNITVVIEALEADAEAEGELYAESLEEESNATTSSNATVSPFEAAAEEETHEITEAHDEIEAEQGAEGGDDAGDVGGDDAGDDDAGDEGGDYAGDVGGDDAGDEDGDDIGDEGGDATGAEGGDDVGVSMIPTSSAATSIPTFSPTPTPVPGDNSTEEEGEPLIWGGGTFPPTAAGTDYDYDQKASGSGGYDEWEDKSGYAFPTPAPFENDDGGYEWGGATWVDPTNRPTVAYVPPPGDTDPLIEEEEPNVAGFAAEDKVLYHGLGGKAGEYLDGVGSPRDMEKDKNLQVVVGILVPLFIVFLLVTAHLVMNHPDGLCAGCCRLTLKIICCFCRTLCLPCRGCCRGTDQAQGRRTHAPMRTPFPTDLDLA